MTMVIFYGAVGYVCIGVVTAMVFLFRPRLIGDHVYHETPIRVRLVLFPGMTVLWPLVWTTLKRGQTDAEISSGHSSGGAGHE